MANKNKKADPDDTLLKHCKRWAENNRVIVAGIIALAVLGGVFAVINSGFEVAENVGLTDASPRPPTPQTPLGFVDPGRLSSPTGSIELTASGDVPILRRDGQDVVSFNYEGMTSSRDIYPDAVTLVASFRVVIEGYSVGAQILPDYIKVASAYDRSRIAEITGSALKLVEGDVVTVLGTHQFRVERVWHEEDRGRTRGDLQTSVLLVPIR
jgi:hypothetical protein